MILSSPKLNDHCKNSQFSKLTLNMDKHLKHYYIVQDYLLFANFPKRLEQILGIFTLELYFYDEVTNFSIKEICIS